MPVFAVDKIVGVTEEFPPYNYTENGKLTGYSVRIVEELLKRAEFEYHLDVYPWTRAYQMATSIPNVLIFTMVRTAERESDFYWIGAVAPRKLYLYKLGSRADIAVNNLEEVKKYRVGVSRADAVEKFLSLKGFVVDKNIDLAPNDLSNLKKLLLGRIDFMSGTELSINYMCKQLGLAEHQIERSLLLVNEGEYFLAMSKQTPKQTVIKIQSSFVEMEKNKVLEDIAKEYKLLKF
jgi:polar amino acid transport system substrate-binding protein